MSEKRFLNCIMAEGILLLILGVSVIILPKLTPVSYGVMIAVAFIAYGIYKLINSIINKNYGNSRVYYIISGLYLLTVGILVLLVPKVSLMWLIALIGIYFLAGSVSSAVYAYFMKGRYDFGGIKLIISALFFITGMSILLGLPMMSFWMVTILSGIAMTVKGAGKLALALINMNHYKI